MTIYFGGEDPVTTEIAQKLIKYCCPDEYPDHTTEDILMRKNGELALSAIPQCVELGRKHPVICVFDSDGRCIIDLLRSKAPLGWQSDHSAINLANDEGEVWLISDRDSFSDYFQIPKQYIPTRQDNRNEISDSLRIKPSLYLLDSVFNHSDSARVRDLMHAEERCRKPSTYNNLWPDYIQNHWNIDAAMENSVSLRRAVQRTSRVFNNNIVRI